MQRHSRHPGPQDRSQNPSALSTAQQDAADSSNRAQNAFLRSRLGQPVALHLLLSDIVLEGTLLAYDDYTILVQAALDDGEREVLCFKHAIAFVR